MCSQTMVLERLVLELPVERLTVVAPMFGKGFFHKTVTIHLHYKQNKKSMEHIF